MNANPLNWIVWPFYSFGWIISLFILFAIFRWLGWGGGNWHRHDWRWHRGYGPWGGPGGDAEEILRTRLAKGEISEAEYERLRDLLRK